MSRKIFFMNENKSTDNSTLFCSICYSPLTNAKFDIATTRCNHLFCTSCIIKSMKFNNTCPLCRAELTSPTKKFCIKYNTSKRIVLEELHYYKAYLTDNINYLINTIEYHTKANTLTDGIKHNLHNELNEVFENFGMGICLNINGKFASFNVYNTGRNEQPDSPIESPNISSAEEQVIIESEGAAMEAAENVTNLRLPSIT